MIINKFLNIPYLTINVLFAGIIILIFIYSGIFSAEKDNHPITCGFYKKYGIKCPTCGISKSFTEIIHGNFKNAKEYNKHGIPVFLFFFIQLFLRIGGMIILIKNYLQQRLLLYLDITISVILFLICFKNLILLQPFI